MCSDEGAWYGGTKVALLSVWNGGFDIKLYDAPQRPSSVGNFKWSAETTLIKVKDVGGKQLNAPVITLQWGFSRLGSTIKTDPVRVVVPSDFHKKAIQQTNK
ncbi:hypothetical protein [Dysgonomonas sp. ZJ279]|uniref:hypothetical protein n=1 Tax=Dysgonomonas sp. ZJ279 TaxID=2709796 RepID=UPI0013EA4F9C|nr:hypothetical protein [Dysgonomonas sp. ZJ279]